MSGLAESDLDAPPVRWWLRIVVLLGIVALFLAAGWGLKSLVGGPEAPKRQVARISILPDTPPPPPPPPPKEEKKPEVPKEEPKQVVREEQLKPDVPKPANEPLKMEGAAGEGASPFSAGSVSREYQGGPPQAGTSAPTGTFSDRAQERFYANSARQLLRDEIEKHLAASAGEVVATFAVWVENDGRIRRIELAGGSTAATDGDVRAALDETSRQLRLPAHDGLAQPMRFRLTLRAAG